MKQSHLTLFGLLVALVIGFALKSIGYPWWIAGAMFAFLSTLTVLLVWVPEDGRDMWGRFTKQFKRK